MIPLQLPYNVYARVPYYRGQQVFRIIGYFNSDDGFLSHTLLILQGNEKPDGTHRIIKKLEQSVTGWYSTDGGLNNTDNSGLLKKLGILPDTAE